MKKRLRAVELLGTLSFALCLRASPLAADSGTVVVLNDDGGWCWFQDERALAAHGKLVIGSVASGFRDPSRKGSVELAVCDLKSGEIKRVELHHQLQLDDHNAPALAVRDDGRWLAVYAKHGPENKFYYRISIRPEDPTAWSEERTFVPSLRSRITYSNLLLLREEGSGHGRMYNFFRGLDDSFKPSYAFSDDGGESWVTGNVVIQVPARAKHRPYAKYATNGRDEIHLFYTEGHPRNYTNSVYHAFYRGGMLRKSDGGEIAPLTEGLARPELGSLLFQGDRGNVAWTSDIHLDAAGRPYVAFSVQKDENDQDHRYHVARWDGRQWHQEEIAYAGSRLYHPENDYTGNICLDPGDPGHVYISADVNPKTGTKLPGGRYEIFEGRRKERNEWVWKPVTQNSTEDNLRPIMPPGEGAGKILLWLRGTYRTYTNYDLQVVGIVEP